MSLEEAQAATPLLFHAYILSVKSNHGCCNEHFEIRVVPRANGCLGAKYLILIQSLMHRQSIISDVDCCNTGSHHAKKLKVKA